MKKSYKRTLTACYMGFITQAIAANFAPLLYLKFNKDYSVPLGKIAVISTALFFTQLVVDIFCAKFVDRIGYRKSTVLSCIFSASGLIGLAFLPELCKDPFAGIIISVILYSVGSGLVEVLCSPIVEACPFDNKDSVMSLLHSFYCWGCVGVIALSTLFFAVFGIGNWKWLICIWALVPIFNIYNFSVCPIEHLVDDDRGMKITELLKSPVFFVSVILMICAGASELSMAQWASAYAEAATGLPKTVGDMLGPCLFAITMGLSRLLYGKYGDKLDLIRFMFASAALCLVCYLLSAIASAPFIGLLGCIMCGFSVGIMWPGTIRISSKALPLGGTAMFAMLAMAGDLGGSLGPWLVGAAAERHSNDMRAGLLAGAVFPVVLLVSLTAIKKFRKTE